MQRLFDDKSSQNKNSTRRLEDILKGAFHRKHSFTTASRDNSEYVACQRRLILLSASRKRKTKRDRGFSNSGEPRFTGERSSKESLDGERENEGENEKVREKKSRTSERHQLKSLRFILFNRGAALSFVPRINSNQLASATPSSLASAVAKAGNIVESRCKAILVATCL